MAEQIVCDECGLTEQRRPLLAGWLCVEPVDDARVLDGDYGPWHFHQPECLQEWAARRAKALTSLP